MREIKFRAWDKDNKKMYPHSSFIYSEDRNGLVGFIENKVSDGEYITLDLMQYTGLKDKNGKEIYEGDIVNLFSWVDDATLEMLDYSPQVISWSFGGEFPHFNLTDTQISGLVYCGGFDELKIIGNIYENPELLEMSFGINYKKRGR